MKNLTIKLLGVNKYTPIVTVENQKLKFKKNKLGNLETSFSTEKDSVEIITFKPLELYGKCWFLMSMLFFVISVLGILDACYDRKSIAIYTRHVIFLQEGDNNLDIVRKPVIANDKAIAMRTDRIVNEYYNMYAIDNKIKKRKRILTGVKLGVWAIGIISLLVYLFLN